MPGLNFVRLIVSATPAFGCFQILLMSCAWIGLSPLGNGADAPPASEAARRLSELLARDWEWTLSEYPTFASAIGDPRYHDRWPDVSFEAISRRQENRLATLRELDSIETGELSGADRLDARLFRHQLQSEIEEYPFEWHLVPLTMRDGIQDESSLADSLEFASEADYRNWLTRLERFPRYLKQTRDLMKAGLAKGLVQPRIIMERVTGQIARQIVDDPTESLFYKPFKNFPPTVSRPVQEEMRATAQRVIAEEIVPGFREFLAFFKEDYLPASQAEIGAWRLPRGRELYALRARQHTTTSLTPRAIHEIGLKEVARIRGEMERIREEVGFSGDLTAFFEHLRTAPEFRHDNEKDLFTAYLAFCKRVDPLLPRLFEVLPRIPYGVEAIPTHMAPDTTTAYYRPPSEDGRRPGTYFVNLYRPESRPTYEIAALSLHEAVPGHHLQIALATEMEEVRHFRRHAHFTAFVEGWALYAESLGDELGLYDTPYDRFGRLTYEMWRAVRLVVDTGMHELEWSREQAIEYFRANAPKSELDIVNEIDRYIGWPGQALAYKIGELKIRELRQLAEQSLGDKFDVRAFHKAVLEQGAIPLDVLEEHIREWIAREQKRER
jgi:prolyl oligopeptidase